LVVGGLLCLLPVFSYRAAISALLAAGPLSEVPPQVQQEALRVAGVLLDEVFAPLVTQALIITAAGLVLVVLGIAVKRGPAPSKPAGA
jgi:hypothetical protein